MKKSEKDTNEYMKKQTTLVVALVTFVAGCLGGFIIGYFFSGSGQQDQASLSPTQAMQQGQGVAEAHAKQIMAMEKQVVADPQNAEAWAQLGHLYFDTHKFPQAIRAYKEYLEIRPGDANVLTDLGVMYRRNGDSLKAIEVFDLAITADPNHEQSRFNKGIVLMYDFNDKKAAIDSWEQLYRLNPSFTTPNGQTLRQLIDTL